MSVTYVHIAAQCLTLTFYCGIEILMLCIYVRKIIIIRVAPKSVLGISTSIFFTFIITAFIHHIVTNFILGMIFSVAGIATIQGIHAIFMDNSNIKDKILENI